MYYVHVSIVTYEAYIYEAPTFSGYKKDKMVIVPKVTNTSKYNSRKFMGHILKTKQNCKYVKEFQCYEVN